MKNFFKRFGVVFLAVMFLFCSLTVSVFAEEAPPDQTDQTETAAVESSAAEVSAIKVATEEDEDLTMLGYYVPAGWSVDAGLCKLVDSSDPVFCWGYFSSYFVPSFVAFGYEYVDGDFVEKADSIVLGSNSGNVYHLTPSDDFCFVAFSSFFSVVDFLDFGAIRFFSAVNGIFDSESFVCYPYIFSPGWTVPEGYTELLQSCSFYLNGKLYEDYYIQIGYSVSDGSLIETTDSIVIYKDSFDDALQLTSDDEFTFQFVDDVFVDIDFFYFMMHNGEMIPPPTLMESILDIFLSVGEWISGAVSALIPLFWDSSAGALTFVGVLSVSGLAFSVSMLLISLISKFLRFGG